MGKRIQTDQAVNGDGLPQFTGDHTSPRSCKPGRRAKEKVNPPLGEVLVKTLRRFLPDFSSLLADLPDRRDPDRVYYPKQTLVISAVLILLLGLRSRRQFRWESTGPAFVSNLNRLSGFSLETAPHDDTIVYYLERLDPDYLRRLPGRIVRRLIRMKALYRGRVRGRFLVAIDGTGQLFFRQRHCKHCLTRKGSNGQVLYFHPVLEAKLVTAGGLAFSLATEFIENTDPHTDKQDCELKAFKRLARSLKTAFPQLPVLLLGDALYANKTVFDICRKNRWDYLFTFKRGTLPELFAEFENLKGLSSGNCTENRDGSCRQRFQWVNDLEHGGHYVNAFDCSETTDRERHYFAWVTNLKLGCRSVVTIANQAGRTRWKIENEGFNIQKNHGYELEHAYSQNPWAARNFYFLIQVAHAVNQLMIKGSLIPDFKRSMGSIRNFLRRLAETIRNFVIDPGLFELELPPFQIRLDSS